MSLVLSFIWDSTEKKISYAIINELTFAVFHSQLNISVTTTNDIDTVVDNLHQYITSGGVAISKTEYKILHAAPAVRGMATGQNAYAPNPFSQHCLNYFQSKFSTFNLQPQMKKFLTGANNTKFKTGLTNLNVIQKKGNARFAKLFQVAFHVRGATHKKLLTKMWAKVTATPSMTKLARQNFEGWYQAL